MQAMYPDNPLTTSFDPSGGLSKFLATEYPGVTSSADLLRFYDIAEGLGYSFLIPNTRYATARDNLEANLRNKAPEYSSSTAPNCTDMRCIV